MKSMRHFGLFSFFVLLSNCTIAQKTNFPEPLSPRTASYEIHVKLDPEMKKLHARETLYWKNPSADTIRELQFHLYLNAFKNTMSTWYKESNGSWNLPEDAKGQEKENIWGWVDIDRIKDVHGNNLTSKQQYIHPDDDNQDDQTVVVIPLAQPILPYETDTFYIHFTAKLPKTRARVGYNRDFHFAVHWFPKVGVYEPAGVRYAKEGQWNCHQFHSRSEFYADFGVYNVEIEVPASYKVGASGLLQKESNNGETKIYSYRAEDVIDFGWTASPNFLEVNDKWGDVDIRVLFYPEHARFGERHLVAAKQILEYMDQHVGKYHYPNLTILHPPLHGLRSGGMEYPTFITSGGGIVGLPDGMMTIETLVMHEFIHQYFMQTVASNEMEEPWMDEGLTSYFENRAMDHYYGKKTSSINLWFFNMGDSESSRNSYVGMPNPKITDVDQYPWEANQGRGFRNVTYFKTATWLKTLEGLVGLETIDEIMQTYYKRWSFRHPAGHDFIAVVNEVVKKKHGDRFGENMNWFFDQVLYSTDVCDYKVAFVNNRKIAGDLGILSNNKSEWITPDEAEQPKDNYHSRVVLHRLGEIKFPVEVLIHFEDGKEELKIWDGQERSHEFSYYGTNKVEWAIIDPENKIEMDLNFINNSYTTKPNKTVVWKYVSRFAVWMQHALQTLSFFI